ncbi:hypothetical protein, partial [Pseudomonas fluorescens]|uniref:hypothetical protein n=1 Tax=Pseudomonas fluorescens TaxID=294 RepID=UPI001C83EA6D
GFREEPFYCLLFLCGQFWPHREQAHSYRELWCACNLNTPENPVGVSLLAMAICLTTHKQRPIIIGFTYRRLPTVTHHLSSN